MEKASSGNSARSRFWLVDFVLFWPIRSFDGPANLSGVLFCKNRYLSLNTSLKDIFPGGFGEVAQQVFHP